MYKKILFVVFLIGVMSWFSVAVYGQAQGADRVDELKKVKDAIKSLHIKLGEPGATDWLTFNDEPDQRFQDYLATNPIIATGERNKIYVQLLGDFTADQRKILNLTIDFIERYFGLPVKLKEEISLSVIPEQAQRKHPAWGMEQVNSIYVLEEIMIPNLPQDAVSYIIFTASDLWPGEEWNFVFGQASTEERVGVWSIYRNGDPSQDQESFKQCLLRTMKTGTHELGHMFSLPHCTFYQCNMCGSMSRKERDFYPVYLCPECLAKLCWATGATVLDRYQKLAEFCQENGLEKEYNYYIQAIELL